MRYAWLWLWVFSIAMPTSILKFWSVKRNDVWWIWYKNWNWLDCQIKSSHIKIDQFVKDKDNCSIIIWHPNSVKFLIEIWDLISFSQKHHITMQTLFKKHFILLFLSFEGRKLVFCHHLSSKSTVFHRL
jgi:hypothetical protein